MIIVGERHACVTCGAVFGNAIEGRSDTWLMVMKLARDHLHQNQEHRVGRSIVYIEGEPDEPVEEPPIE